jgi:zinc protease
MSAEVQGNKLNMITVQDAENQVMIQRLLMGGNEMTKTLLKNGKAIVSGMGQSQTLPDEQFEYLKMSMWIVPELLYETMGYTISSDGVKDVDGETAYKLLITNPTGGEIVNYYSTGTGLKIKSEDTISGVTSYGRYEEFDGVLLPVQISVESPMIPFPLNFEVDDIKVNVILTAEELN